MRKLTSRQWEIVIFILDYQAEHGKAPTTREIQDKLGLSSPRTVTKHLDALEKKKAITRTPGKHRNVVVLQE